MNTKFKLFALSAFIMATFNSCYEGVVIEGNNESAEETRQLPDFTEVTSSGSFNIYYSQGDSTSVKIEAESNLIPYIETAVFDGRLDIRFASHVNVQLNQVIDIYVTNPSVNKIQLSGSGKIVADSVSSNFIELDVSGSGNIQTHFYGHHFKSSISGSGLMNIIADCDTVETNISGSGRINLEAYDLKITNVTISGSGKAELTGSSDKVTFTVVGSGKISAYEFPVNKADVIVSGSGDVYVNVSDYLDAILSGSGDLYYKGSPQTNISVSGSGKTHHEN
jgi:hypothetical protein